MLPIYVGHWNLDHNSLQEQPESQSCKRCKESGHEDEFQMLGLTLES